MVRGHADRMFDIFIYATMLILCVVFVFPLLYVISVSLTPYTEVLKHGGYMIFPTKIDFEAYKTLFNDDAIPRSFRISLIITVGGTLISTFLTVLMAYPLSRKKLKLRSFFLLYVVFTMLFNGGIIPTYLVVQDLGLLNTVWAMMIPNALTAFNILLMKSFMESIPEEIFESARMDGAKENRVLWQIVLPLSVPSLLTIGLFYAVTQWNMFFNAVMYVTDAKLYPLQVIVRNIITSSTLANMINEVVVPTMTLNMAAVVVSSVPIIAVYPFIQKHFMKGMLMGSLKG
ncbi:carbohydrate ABC transporter permease [Paenibacillus sp. CGMCC 1.16610]|uniref:ABC transporter permease subunit n=1 Tax=Paenibacillus anseongense TaxID=2682845 RepID=A0ABW9U1I2_9BACL|nr:MULTISPECIES: carbohydrate ABC transporter permease [Paenibacillus]MBA2936976.1 carbohydrate ABC transporter permease [Paenibacillus sp. CGMCC 1.16610]MVQ33301.1 ABC transporter permease subunit [Paenibacillus anseongense]